jgi:hypothetical protein
MSVTVAELNAVLTADTAAFERSMSSATTTADTFGKKLSDFGTKATTFVTLPLVAAGGAAFNMAGDFNESFSKMSTVFGASAKDIEAWSKSSSTAMGLSQKEAIDAAGSFGNMFTQLGIGSDEAAGMSKEMIQLAADLGSFHNADITAVIEAQSAAFRGEYDSVQKFVPTINAASVEQKALAMGLAKSTKELDAQDKAIAVQALLMEGAGAATGDFARTADSAANQQRILTADFKNASTELGQNLLPIGQQVIGWLSKMVGWFSDLSPGVQKVMLGLAGVAAAAGPVAKGIQGILALHTQIGKMVKVIKEWHLVEKARVAFTKTATAVQWAFNAAMTANPVVLVVAAIAAFIAILVVAYNKVDWFQHIVEVAFDALVGAFKFLLGAAKAVFGWVKDHWPLLLAILTGPIGLAIAAFVKFKDDIIGAFAGALKWLLDVGKKIVQGLLDGIQWIWEHSLVGWLLGRKDAIIGFFADAAKWLLDVGKSVLQGLLDGIVWLWEHSLHGWLFGRKDAIIGFFADALNWLLDAGKKIIEGLFNGVKEVWNLVAGFLGTIGHLAGTAVGNLAETLVGLGRSLLQGLWNGVVAIWNALAGWLGTIGHLAGTAIGNLAATLVGLGRSLIQGLWDGVTAIWNALAGWLRTIGHLAGSAIGDLGAALFGIGKSLIGGLWAGITWIWDMWILNFLRAIGHLVGSAIGDLSQTLWGIGKSLITGLWGGMKDAWKDVTGWLGSVGGWVVDLKGPPAKDAVLLTNNGQLIMQGLQAGMEKEWESVSGWLQSRGMTIEGATLSASTLSGGSGSGGTASPVAATGGNVYTVNVYAWDTRDGGDKVVEAIAAYERRNGNGWRN